MGRKKWKPFNLGVLDDGVEAAYELAEKANLAASRRNLVSTISRSKYYIGTSDGVKVDVTYQSKHKVLEDCHGLVLAYGNMYTDDRTTDLAPYTVNVSVNISGTNYPLFFNNGNKTKIVELGAVVRTDELNIGLKKGDMIYVRTHVFQNAGEKHPTGLMLLSTNNEGYANGDVTRGTAFNITGSSLNGLTPLALYATPINRKQFKTLGIVGSSSSIGTGRDNTPIEDNPAGEIGYLQLGALRAGWGYVTCGTGGQKASEFVGTKRRSRMELLRSCDVVVVQYASNDLADTSTTFETLKDNILKIHQAFWEMGIPTFQVTLNPRTSSTDKFKTLENQTPTNANFVAGPDSARGKFNAWVMSNEDGIVGVDANVGWESSPNSGLWRVDQVCTTDGVHPNNFGHDNEAANAVRDFLLKQK